VSYAARVASIEQDTFNKRTEMVDTLARQVQDRADEKHALWRVAYRDCEANYFREVCSAEVPALDYGDVRQKVENNYRAAFRANTADALQCLANTCAPPSCAATRSLSIHQASATAWGVEGALRASEDERRLLVAQADERKRWVVNAGNGSFGSVSSGTLAAASIYSRLADNAGASANGALAFIGANLRALSTATTQAPASRTPYVPKPYQRAATPPKVVGTGADPYDVRFERYVPTTVPSEEPDAAPDPHDNRFPRHIATDFEEVPEDPDAPMGGRMGRGRDQPYLVPK
jgi:hypothetical protein